jgi:hypothetical protein
MKISKRQLKLIIREEYSRLKRRGLIRESMYEIPSEGKGSIEDIIDACVKDCQADPEASVESICEQWLSMYGIPYDQYDMIINAVYQRL